MTSCRCGGCTRICYRNGRCKFCYYKCWNGHITQQKLDTLNNEGCVVVP